MRAALEAAAPLIDRADAFGIEIAEANARLASALAAADACAGELGEAIDHRAVADELHASSRRVHERETIIDMATGRPIVGEP